MPWTTNWVVPDFPQQAAATALLFSLSSLQKSMICPFFYVFKHVIVTFRGTFIWLSSCHLQGYMCMVVILSSSEVHVNGCHPVIFRSTCIWLSSCHLQGYNMVVILSSSGRHVYGWTALDISCIAEGKLPLQYPIPSWLSFLSLPLWWTPEHFPPTNGGLWQYRHSSLWAQQVWELCWPSQQLHLDCCYWLMEQGGVFCCSFCNFYFLLYMCMSNSSWSATAFRPSRFSFHAPVDLVMCHPSCLQIHSAPLTCCIDLDRLVVFLFALWNRQSRGVWMLNELHWCY